MLHATGLHHARSGDDDARILPAVQGLRLLHVADEGQAAEAEGVRVILDDILYLVVEQVDVQTEDLRGVDGQGTVHKYRDLLGEPTLVVEVVQQINDLLSAADGKGRNDQFTSFFYTSIVYNI